MKKRLNLIVFKHTTQCSQVQVELETLVDNFTSTGWKY